MSSEVWMVTVEAAWLLIGPLYRVRARTLARPGEAWILARRQVMTED
jgi:hypothetical protein